MLHRLVALATSLLLATCGGPAPTANTGVCSGVCSGASAGADGSVRDATVQRAGQPAVRFPLIELAPEALPDRAEWVLPEGTLRFDRLRSTHSAVLSFATPSGTSIARGTQQRGRTAPVHIDTQTLHVADFDGDGIAELNFRFLYPTDGGHNPGAWTVLANGNVHRRRVCGGGDERLCDGCPHPASRTNFSPAVVRLALDFVHRHRPPTDATGAGREVDYSLSIGRFYASWYYNEDCGSLNLTCTVNDDYTSRATAIASDAFRLVLDCAERPPARAPMRSWCAWLLDGT